MIKHVFVLENILFDKKQKARPALLFSIIIVLSLLTSCKEKVDASPRPRVPAKDGIVKLDNPNIYINGAAYVSSTSSKLSFKRFSDNALNASTDIRRFDPNVALSTSGISIQFKAKSSLINLIFTPETGLDEKGAFKILRDGIELQTIQFNGPVSQPIDISLKSLPIDKEYVYEIILPSYVNISLTKLELDKGSELISYTPTPKKVYISFGDSITHGRGQDGCTFLTYPYLLSQKLNMTLFNLGIGGARISMPVAETSKDLPKADLITILIGFNDYEGANQTATQFELNYKAYLSEIRKNHPMAEIYCITLLYTTRTSNTTTGLTPDVFRNVVKNIVSEYQANDSKIHLIEGDKITSATDLVDRVHLNIDGADRLANQLYLKINK